MNERGMRVSLAAVATTIAGLAVMATASTAAVDAPLSGKFLATVQTIKATFPVDMQPVERDYKFKCLNKRCSKAQFKREAGNGTFKSKLKEQKPGVYRGVEKEKDSDCPDTNGTALRKTTHKVTVTKETKSGKARKLKGNAKYAWADCDGSPTQKTRFTAVRK